MSERARRLVLAEDIPEGLSEIRLDDDAAHYVTRVLRLAEGARVEAITRCGRHVEGRLSWREGHPWIEGACTLTTPAPVAPLVVIAALIKPNRWEWMLEKAAELGATDIAPLNAARSVVKIPAERLEKRVARWQKIVDGATRQCGRPDRVLVHPPSALADALSAWFHLSVGHADEGAHPTPGPPGLRVRGARSLSARRAGSPKKSETSTRRWRPRHRARHLAAAGRDRGRVRTLGAALLRDAELW